MADIIGYVITGAAFISLAGFISCAAIALIA